MKGRPGGRRYPLAALCEALACAPDDLKARLGLDRRQIAAYLERGIPEARADQLAVKAGLAAATVWPEMIDHAIEDTSVACAANGCEVRFVPTRKGHRFCSSGCYHRQWNADWFRERYANDPEFRAKQRARAKAYRAKAARALKLKQQRWKAENADRQREYRRRYYLANRERLLAKQREYDRRKREEAA